MLWRRTACCEGVCCGEGQVCGNNGNCCPKPPESCGPCEELVEDPETGCVVCQAKPDCECPEFNGCSSCEIETVDENGCPICESNCAGSCEICENGTCVDQTVRIETGLCCDEGEVDCCPLTDTCDACTITDISQCECEEGYQRTPLGDCIECPIANIATGNRYAPCIVSSAGSIDVVAPGNYGCCCIGGGEGWYPKGDGSGECISCVPPKIFDGYDDCICEEGEECGINCCGEGERCINESSCCPEAQICENELFSTCCPDGQICVNGSCEEPCSEEAPVPCSLNGESWCCAEENTCGSAQGQCCQDGICCEDGQSLFYEKHYGFSECCIPSAWHKTTWDYWYDANSDSWSIGYEFYDCATCPSGQEFLCYFNEEHTSSGYILTKMCTCCPSESGICSENNLVPFDQFDTVYRDKISQIPFDI